MFVGCGGPGALLRCTIDTPLPPESMPSLLRPRGLLAPGRPSGTFGRPKVPKNRQPYGLDPLMMTGEFIFSLRSDSLSSPLLCNGPPAVLTPPEYAYWRLVLWVPIARYPQYSIPNAT